MTTSALNKAFLAKSRAFIAKVFSFSHFPFISGVSIPRILMAIFFQQYQAAH
tara:strand:+ start:171 stop:326 length:156 start_codon:yes stop_codon:yes gene_type:complete